MSYAIVFSSKTGNTALLAQTLQEQLPQADCCYFGVPDAAALAADTLYVGFWTDKGKADADTLELLQQLHGKRVFLFGTAGFGGSAPYFEKILAATRKALDGTPACSGTTAGYPTLRRGSRGCYVMVLQDALSTLGYQTGSRIDGIFGARTEQALRGYQKRTSLRVDGVCGCDSWKKISTAVIGIGRTKTTID